MPGKGYDISLMAASLFDDNPVFKVWDTTFSSTTGLEKMTLDLEHERFKMYGFTANKLIDKFVFKIEAAYYQDKSFNVLNQSLYTQIDPNTGIPRFMFDQKLTESLLLIEKRNVINTVFGFDYTYSDELTISVNQQYQKVLDFEDKLMTQEETYITFVNFNFSFLNDTLNPSYTVFYFGKDDDYIHKLKVEYETTMGFTVAAGTDIVAPSNTNSTIGRFKDTSRFWAEVTYSF